MDAKFVRNNVNLLSLQFDNVENRLCIIILIFFKQIKIYF